MAEETNPGISELARLLGVDEPAAREIVADLVDEGYLVTTREGHRDRYEINRKAHLRHPLFDDVEIGPLVDALKRPPGGVPGGRSLPGR